LEISGIFGIGPSAHSYNGFDVRSWNVANNQQYIKKLNEKILPKEEEILSQEDQFNEMIMIGLEQFGVLILQV
jgi:oxygen-independent coproporphyrinogen-3 oxidase